LVVTVDSQIQYKPYSPQFKTATTISKEYVIWQETRCTLSLTLFEIIGNRKSGKIVKSELIDNVYIKDMAVLAFKFKVPLTTNFFLIDRKSWHDFQYFCENKNEFLQNLLILWQFKDAVQSVCKQRLCLHFGIQNNEFYSTTISIFMILEYNKLSTDNNQALQEHKMK
jgi:hypothetical protein